MEKTGPTKRTREQLLYHMLMMAVAGEVMIWLQAPWAPALMGPSNIFFFSCNISLSLFVSLFHRFSFFLCLSFSLAYWVRILVRVGKKL